jgi:ATP-dependent exoDNAse (exonuclease V) beta subunit
MSPAAETHVDLDAWARAEALDTRRSFIVRAPAGSGKTQLLTLRLLSLLSTVDEPEEVLAITFTKAATAEMRERVITALRRAASGEMLDEIEGSPAAAALEHARARGWGLLDQPHRLNIQTIDSLSLQIAHGAPLLSRLGGQLQPTEDSEPLYALAARRTMEQLGGSNVGLSDALKHLLRLRDVKLDNCESLIAEMLARRDEWLGQLSNVRQLHEEDWRLLRDQLEEPFRTERTQVMARVKHLLAGPAGEQLFELAAYACSNNPSAPIHGLKGLTRVDELEDISHFHCVRELLLTTGNEWRKSVNKAIGFPTPKDGGSAAHKQKFERLLAHFGTNDQLLEALCALRKLPEEKFSDDEWHTVRSIFTVLYYAAGQLRVVFAEKAKIDFVELGMTAGAALDDREECRRWSGNTSCSRIW